MGFGTFFIGYFLLLDITYYLLTDVIAAAVMTLGLARLSHFNRGFKAAFAVAGIFVVFALAEFGFGAYDMLFSRLSPTVVSYIAIARNLILCILTFTAFEGMREVAAEVGLAELAKKCRITSYVAMPIYILAIASETPSIFAFASAQVAAVIGVISLIASFVFIIANLFTVYTCYAKICMPEDVDNEPKNKASEGKADSFLSSYKRQKAEREAAHAEYKKQRLAEKNQKGKK